MVVSRVRSWHGGRRRLHHQGRPRAARTKAIENRVEWFSNKVHHPTCYRVVDGEGAGVDVAVRDHWFRQSVTCRLTGGPSGRASGPLRRRIAPRADRQNTAPSRHWRIERGRPGARVSTGAHPSFGATLDPDETLDERYHAPRKREQSPLYAIRFVSVRGVDQRRWIRNRRLGVHRRDRRPVIGATVHRFDHQMCAVDTETTHTDQYELRAAGPITTRRAPPTSPRPRRPGSRCCRRSRSRGRSGVRRPRAPRRAPRRSRR